MATKIINGINVKQLVETINQIKENPEIAKFKFRAANKWEDGTHNRALLTSFYGALNEDDSRDPMMFEIDEPPVLLGSNKGPNPVEYLLVGLSGCLVTTLVAQAATKNIRIRSLACRLEGDIDLQGFLGISEKVPVGYQEIRIYFKIDADITNREKEELIEMAQKFSPVFNTVVNPTPVVVQLDQG